MKTDDKDQVLCTRFRRALAAEVDRLDADTRVRLRQARLRALAAADGRRGTVFDVIHAWRWLTGGGLAVAAAVVAAIAIWLTQPRDPHILKSAEDVEIVAAQEQLELCEDLEFYRWLATSGEGARNEGKGNVR
jgi:hypothetical protein